MALILVRVKWSFFLFVESHLGFFFWELSICDIFIFPEKGKLRHRLATPQQVSGRFNLALVWCSSLCLSDTVKVEGTDSGASFASTSCVTPDKSLHLSVFVFICNMGMLIVPPHRVVLRL